MMTMQANCMFKQKCYAKLNAVTFSLFTQVDVIVLVQYTHMCNCIITVYDIR